MAEIDESQTVTVVNHQEQNFSNESDADSGIDEYLGTNNFDENLDNSSIPKSKQILSKKDLEEIKRYNLSIRTSIYKEVRRPGKSKYTDF